MDVSQHSTIWLHPVSLSAIIYQDVANYFNYLCCKHHQQRWVYQSLY